MSSHKQKDLSPIWPRGDAIDQLIYQALLGEVRDAEPSSHVWENICQFIAAADVTSPDKRSEVWIRSLLSNVLVFFNNLLYDRSWETRLAERRPLLPWADRLSLII